MLLFVGSIIIGLVAFTTFLSERLDDGAQWTCPHCKIGECYWAGSYMDKTYCTNPECNKKRHNVGNTLNTIDKS